MGRGFKSLIFICSILMLAFMGSAQNQKMDSLRLYQQIQAESKNHRYFRYEDGAPKSDSYETCIDNYGYLWVKTHKYYLFNGITFKDMLSLVSASERDSIINPTDSGFQTTDKRIMIASRQSLYQWNGYAFKKYLFPKYDRIVLYKVSGNKVLCIGVHGFAVLDSGKWVYTKIKMPEVFNEGGFLLPVKDTRTIMSLTMQQFEIDAHNKLHTFSNRLSLVVQLGSRSRVVGLASRRDGDLEVSCYSKEGLSKATIMNSVEFNKLIEQGKTPIPTLSSSPQGLALYVQGSNVLFKYNDKEMSFTPLHLGVENVITDFDADYVYHTRGDSLFITSLQDLGTSAQIDYYIPAKDYKPDEYRYLILDEDKDENLVPHRTGSGDKLKVYKLYKNVAYLNPVATASISADGYIFEHNNLIYSSTEADKPGIHTITLHNLYYEGLKRTIKVTDPANKLKLLSFNKAGNCLLVAGKEQLHLINLNQPCIAVNTIPADAYTRIWKTAWGTGLFLDRDSDLSFVAQVGDTYKTLKKVSKAREEYFQIENRAAISSGDNRQVHCFSSQRPEVFSIKSKSKNRSMTITGISLLGDTVLDMDNDFTYTVTAKGESRTGEATALRLLLEDRYKKHKLHNVLNPHTAPSLISENMILMPYHRFIANKRDEGYYYEYAVIKSDRELYLPNDIEIKHGSGSTLHFPSILYDMKNDVAIFQPTWMSALICEDKEYSSVYILHIESPDGKQQMRFSRYRNGKLELDDSDLVLTITNNRYPEYKVHYIGNKFGIELNGILHYPERNTWKSVSLEQYSRFGGLRSVAARRNELWLAFDSAVVRLSIPSNQSFLFTQKDGIPERIDDLYINAGNIYILSDKTVYRFAPEADGATLLVPRLIANGKSYNAASLVTLKHNRNNVIFAVDILNTIFPEKMKLAYRLLGYEKEWKQRDYTPQIEYPRLPPGRYEFQINATSPIGRRAKTLSVFFIIKPPIYGTWWAYLLYAILLFLLGRYLYRLRIRQLEARNASLEKTIAVRTHELQERQQHIKQSIDYASLIQQSTLPQEADMLDAFAEHFVIWKPRDTVGGDFYWMHKTATGIVYFAVIDCTGHGVPGALMSMTVYSLLNHIIKDDGLNEPAEILQSLHREISFALHQDKEHTQQDGVEISLLKISPESLVFCGAGLHLLYHSNATEGIIQIRGDKRGLGGLRWRSELELNEHTIPHKPGMTVYLYTDGIVDQPLPQRDRLVRFGQAKLIELLSATVKTDMDIQEQAINEKIKLLLEYHEQRDDITVVGLKLR